MGRKAVVLMEQKVDFQISVLENKIAELVSQIVELKAEKTEIRSYYEKRVAERKKAKWEKADTLKVLADTQTLAER